MSAFFDDLKFGFCMGTQDVFSNVAWGLGAFASWNLFNRISNQCWLQPFSNFNSCFFYDNSAFSMPMPQMNFWQTNMPTFNIFEQTPHYSDDLFKLPSIDLFQRTTYVDQPWYLSTKTKDDDAEKVAETDFEKKQKVKTETKTKTSLTKSGTKPSTSVKYWKEMTDDEMREVYGDYDYDITSKSNITAEQLNKFLSTKNGSVLQGKGEIFIKAEKKYGISALALMGICGIETGYGTKGNAINGYNNVGNLEKPKDATYPGRWRRFDSPEECVMEMARLLKENYVDKSGKEGVHLKKLYQVNSKYCPAKEIQENAAWAERVQACMDSVLKRIA